MQALEALDNPAWRDSDKRLGWPASQRNPFDHASAFVQMFCVFKQPRRVGILRAKGDDHAG
jgi:hypothetical protein